MRLGARSPHAEGWPLKTLAVLPALVVYYAPCSDQTAAERQMLGAFAAGASAASRRSLHDPERVMPFANLAFPKGVRKRHGIKGSKEPRRRSPEFPKASRTPAKGQAGKPAGSTAARGGDTPTTNAAALRGVRGGCRFRAPGANDLRPCRERCRVAPSPWMRRWPLHRVR